MVKTFRTRIALLTAAVSGVLLLGFGAVAWWLAQRQFQRALENRVYEAGQRLWPRLNPRMDPDLLRKGIAEAFPDPDQPAPWVILRTHGPVPQTLVSSVPAEEFASVLLPPTRRPPIPDGRGRGRPGPEPPQQQPWRRRAVDPPAPENPPDNPLPRPVPGNPNPQGQRRLALLAGAPLYFLARAADGERCFGVFSTPECAIVLALPAAEFRADSRRLAWTFAGAGAGGLALAAVVAAWASRRALRPLDDVVRTAQSLTAQQLDRRIPLTGKEDAEFARLITALNAMTDRLAVSFAQALRFSADASHELNTPLAVMQATLADALHGCPADDPRCATLTSLAEEAGRLKSISASLLLLARADAGHLPVQWEIQSLSDEAETLAEDAGILCEPAGLTFSLTLPDTPAMVRADRSMTRQILRNLLTNAVKYNRPGGEVSCAVTTGPDGTDLVIANSGPGIPAEDLPRLFERFYRGDKARSSASGGTGLGLNIARELARANGAELTLETSGPDRTAFRLHFPPL